jgi:hypothetical protein
MVRSLALMVASLGLVGCASTSPTARRATIPVGSASAQRGSDTTGVWDWMFSSRDDQGDERLEQEEWHLTQKGSHVSGYYLRKVTMLSVDERLFRCNQRLGFTKVTRVTVDGRVAGERIELREVGFEAKPGPCDDGARQLVQYQGLLQGPVLVLKWGPDAGQRLTRRLDNGQPPLLQAADFQAEPGNNPWQRASNAPGLTMPVDGVWEWELRSIDADGDERWEREEWHLTETEEGIVGFYDRSVKRVRAEGTFEQVAKTCKTDHFETTTRYTVRGVRSGGSFSLREVDYAARASDCDNAMRRLDNYQGHITDPDSLVLSWGPGNQLLRRKAAASASR